MASSRKVSAKISEGSSKFGKGLSFDSLVSSIADVDQRIRVSAVHAVNASLTLRNWCIGANIHVFELQGLERAKYGERLFECVADELKRRGFVQCGVRNLRLFAAFYEEYPQLFEVVPEEMKGELSKVCKELAEGDSQEEQKRYAQIDGKVNSVSAKLRTPPEELISHLSFTHFRQLLEIKQPLKRTFYEVECIKATWSVRELKRQIDSQLFERTGLSKNMAECVRLANAGAEAMRPELVVRDPYVFEFLGLGWKDVVSESDLEKALLDKLEDFLLELGYGFCFEARQKHMLIGSDYYSVDLVFYHRVLRCHVMVDLKMEGFSYEHAGQMNMYLNWFHENMIIEGDIPPVGIVLCPNKDDKVVEYAMAGLSNEVFVSRYESVLPKPEELERFVRDETDNLKERGVVYRP